MKCIKCNTSVTKTMIHRTGEIGKEPNWMCESCIAKIEPELHRNIYEEEINKDLKEICYPF